ncbi:hypothetical protein [Deinococcus yavapaiensis]|uniref:Uncharacterized protein n=1 Tax=Deinococcus yavapaiensis KR-236 TaxID=694435 RepID=A0A318S8X3_9DEIO|nr:hypothetical protein [Deinococcus yavapaiensis]PYE55640.1 hypothetical protein DES52_1023 [Deinococcus yavapaiensis KR-236]
MKRTLFSLLFLAIASTSAAATYESRTWQESIAGHKVFTTVVTPSPDPKGQMPWTWGNTSDSWYIFALNDLRNVRFALSFEQLDGKQRATIVYTRPEQPALGVVVKKSGVALLNSALFPRYLMEVTKGWIVDGRPNYNLKIYTDGVKDPDRGRIYADGQVDTVRTVTADVDGLPFREEGFVVQDMYPNRGFPRYLLAQRVETPKPLELSAPFMPTFPYLGIGSRSPDWYQANPNPIYFSLLSNTLEFRPYVGFHTAGMYQINSVSSKTKNFENPFVLYRFRPGASRSADLVIRGSNFKAGDRFGVAPYYLNRTTFRYSWKTADEGKWSYSLGLSSSLERPFEPGTDQDTIAKNYKSLPSRIVRAKWQAISFVHSLDGIAGSEGIYHFSAQDDAVWEMAKSGSTEPFFLSKLILTNDLILRGNTAKTLPLGSRGEYYFGLPKLPELYKSSFTGLIHLKNAQRGYWYDKQGEYFLFEDLDKDGQFDSIQRCRAPLFSEVQLEVDKFDCKEQLLHYRNKVFLISNNRIIFKTTPPMRASTTIAIPKDRSSWNAFLSVGDQSRTTFNLSELWGRFNGTTKSVGISGIDNLYTSNDNLYVLYRSRTGDSRVAIVNKHGDVTFSNIKRNPPTISYDRSYSEKLGSYVIVISVEATNALHEPGTMHIEADERLIFNTEIKTSSSKNSSFQLLVPSQSRKSQTVRIFWNDDLISSFILPKVGPQRTASINMPDRSLYYVWLGTIFSIVTSIIVAISIIWRRYGL